MRFPETELLGVCWLSQKRKIMEIWTVYSDIQFKHFFSVAVQGPEMLYIIFVFKNIDKPACVWRKLLVSISFHSFFPPS